MSPRKPRKPHAYDLELWNSIYPVGTVCDLILDNGQTLRTKTRSEAWNLGHGQAVVSVEGKTGGQTLERIRFVEMHSATTPPARPLAATGNGRSAT